MLLSPKFDFKSSLLKTLILFLLHTIHVIIIIEYKKLLESCLKLLKCYPNNTEVAYLDLEALYTYFLLSVASSASYGSSHENEFPVYTVFSLF